MFPAVHYTVSAGVVGADDAVESSPTTNSLQFSPPLHTPISFKQVTPCVNEIFAHPTQPHTQTQDTHGHTRTKGEPRCATGLQGAAYAVS